MKIKDIESTANIAWSPSNQTPVLLAAGTAAQQLDASFNTNAALEIYSLNLLEPGLDMQLTSSVTTDQRFQKIVWGSHGEDASGTIVGGCDGGIVEIYSVSKLLKGVNGLVGQQNKHKGAVHALDFNPFKQNLLATGAGESEIYIWDLNKTSVPMTPGTKSQPFEDVMHISWNRQVQHILASTFPSKCVVWDLRKNEPIIKLTDTASRIRWKVVAWHPEVATQLCLASEEDQAPVIQLWDLRFATSPLKTLENHQRGVLSIAWCAQDSDLLVSCGKDNRILCWNPNSNNQGGEVLSEIAKTNQWNFDVAWCPKNPALIACPSFDGHVSVYSVMGGKTQQIQTTDKIADSFPGMDGYVQAPVPQPSTAPASVDLIKAPRWLKRPVRTSFAFGGKLVTFTNEATQASGTEQASPSGTRSVYISQVITEPELVNQSALLEQALEYGNFTEYCRNKADALDDQHKRNIWYFLKANFEDNPRGELLNLLGYKIEDVANKLNDVIGHELDNGLTDQFSNLIQCNFSDEENNCSSKGSSDNSPGSYENLVSNQFASKAQHVELKQYTIKTTNDTEGYITQALLLGNIEAAVELCLKAERYADAIIIAMTGGSELLARTQFKYLSKTGNYVSSLISALVAEDWSSVINNCDIHSWKEALVAALTHSSDEDLPKLCELLGNRLEEEGHSNSKLALDAQLCYICAGSFDKLVNSWSGSVKRSSSELQELVELVTFLQKAVERQGRSVEINGSLADLLSFYASILASQGNLSTALTYLGNSKNEQVSNLRDRLSISLGQKPIYQQVQPRSRYSSRHSFSSNSGQVNPPMLNPINPLYNQMSSGLPTPPATQPWQQQVPNFNQSALPKTFSPPPAQPNRPPSVGPAHGGGITSRSKYVVDPSVQSGGPYGTRSQYGSPMMPIPQQPQSGAYQPSSYFANNSPPNQAPLIPNIPQPNPSAFYNPSNVPVDQAEPALPPTPRLHNVIPPSLAALGWNDPPVLTRSSTRNQPKQDFSQAEPITHPLYGTAPAQSIPPSNGFVDQSQHLSTYGAQNPYNQSMPPLAPNNAQILQPSFNAQSINPPTFNQNALNTNFQNQAQQQRQSPAVIEKQPPQPIQKEPIPDEYKVIQTVFEDLRTQCAYAANNPQTKRKLEDVARKLELLYDLLREHKLSPNTISSLQQLVELVQTGEYTSCLGLHTQLVSGHDFAQIASFMPGLKVLIQCALQLQVYLR